MSSLVNMKKLTHMKIISSIAVTSASFVYLSKSRVYAISSDNNNTWLSNIFNFSASNDDKMLHATQSVMKKQEYTKTITIENKPSPVLWFETNHYNANHPIEDRHCECYLKNDNSYFFGIFDGHSGWHCSESLRKRLPYYLALAFMPSTERRSLTEKGVLDETIVEYYSNPSDDCPTFDFPPGFTDKQDRLKTGVVNFGQNVEQFSKDNTVGDILKYTYLSLDRDISKEAIPDGICNDPIWAGLSGAVAIGAYVKGNDLYIANTGDCRGVLGVKSSTGCRYDIALSDDHTASNHAEVARLKKNHPGEVGVIKHERLLGQLQPLRSFGDVIYKWTKELHREVVDVVFGRAVVPKNIYLTPPYLTAQPDVQHKKLDCNDRFVILATDGLWDTVSNEMAVKIIGDYLNEIKQRKSIKENGATRLLKFALSQGSDSKLIDMLRLPTNLRRNYHDDITVTVIYFDQDYQNFKSKL